MISISRISASLVFMIVFLSGNSFAQENDPWIKAKHIIDSVGTIVFPEKIFNVIDFGAVTDGRTDNTNAFKKTIKICSEKGGGKVMVPAGKYLTGPIHLASNVNLHLLEGAEIIFSTNPKKYYPLVHTSFEGTELMNYSPLIYAYNCKNVGITGKGILNGSADTTNWWPWCGKKEYGWKKGNPSQNDSQNRPKLEKMAEDNTSIENRIFGDKHYLRPSFIEPFGCSNVLIEGVKIINAPFWIIHPIKCTNVIIDGVNIESHGPNNDGCDPEYSKNVIIKNSTFNTGDDCIAIKSGRNADGRRVGIKSENIVVQKCRMVDGHGGVVIGSEVSAGVSNVYAEDCIMSSPELDRIIRIKTNSKRGGIIENIYARNIEVGQVKEAVLHITMFYDVYGSQTGNYLPIVRNIYLENIHVKDGGKFSFWARGHKESPINGITIKNVTIEKAGVDFSFENVENIRFINTSVNGKVMESE